MYQSNHIPPEKQARLESLVNLIEHSMPLAKWGFKQRVEFLSRYRPDVIFPSGPRAFPTVIYDSEHCRVKFLLDRERDGDDLVVYYGRFHAPDDEGLMRWNNEDCYCWHAEHNSSLALKFLDGVSPSEIVHQQWTHPLGLQIFMNAESQPTVGQPEWMVRKHAVIWEHYGDQLFELFDLRRSDLWAQYAQFIKEYYDLFGRVQNITPSFDKIC